MANMKLVMSIINFLKEESKRETFTPDTRESLEVAVQCLQTAYDIDSTDNKPNEKDIIPSLEDVFNSAIISSEESEVTASGELKKAEMMKNLGNSLMKKNQFVEAIRYYDAAIDLDNRNAIYYGNRAAAYSKLNDFKNAIADCEKAIEIDPKYAKAYGRMGLAYTSLGNSEKAKEAFKKAVELDPTNESYQSNLALASEKGEKSAGPPPIQGGLNIDWGNLFNNPAFRNMASTLMQDQNLISALSAGVNNVRTQGAGAASPSANEGSASSSGATAGNARSFDMLLEAGQYLAAQMQAANPDLVEQLRQTASRNSNPPNGAEKRD